MDTKSKGKKPTCFVPECSNLVGVLFPRTTEAKKKWLESLEIIDKEPKPNSFVCLDHFKDGEAGVGREREIEHPVSNRVHGNCSKKPLPKRKIDKDTERSKRNNQEKNTENKKEKETLIPRSTQNTEKKIKYKNSSRAKGESQGNTKEKRRTKSISQKSAELTEEEFDKELQKLFENEKYKECPDEHFETGSNQLNRIQQENTTKAFRYKVVIPDRELWQSKNLREQFEENAVICYTDGSKLSERQTTGSGVYVEDQEVRKSYPLGEQATVFQAEVYAIIMAATMEEIKNEVDADIKNMCRLCMENKGDLESIYNKLDDNHTIIHAMIVCLFPLKVTPGDKLSTKICKICLKSLKDFFEFRIFCLEMDKKQQKYRGIEFDYMSNDSDEDGDKEMDLTDSLPQQKDKNKSGTQQEKEGTIHLDDANTKHQSRKKNTQKSDMNNEELLRVLEDDIPDKASRPKKISESSKHPSEAVELVEVESYENITIDIVKDENDDTSSYKLTSSKLPITIKPVNQTNTLQNRKRKPDKITRETDCAKLIKTSEGEVIIMPKDIKVRMVTVADVNLRKEVVNTAPDIVPKKMENEYISSKGTTTGVPIAYLLDSEFFEADKYVYEFRLSKEEGRNLNCLAPECAAEAYQRRIDLKTFSDEINLIVPHNHQPFTPVEKKTLMFYNVLRRNMQKNKSYNFRTLYEDLVSLDPAIKSIVPLAGVIDGLCKYCPVPEIPKFNTFDDLFDLIEEKCFYKIHFTTSGEQFYQDRFECHDGSKAIVFANQEKISSCSYTKLMYVDTSFQIMKDIFSYQLVTVLAWVHDTFFPILYAFINKQSEDIFRVIFGFLYNSLAPSLRPDEIITEYDADVYYALAETYVESRIGGSFFSYFQNVYKATCALNLTKQLESNPTFRSMYYMLLMLPLLPPTTISVGFSNIEGQIEDAGLLPKIKPLLQYYSDEWLERVTPEFFCVHRLESRTFNNLVAPFKKLKSLVVTCKNRNRHPTIIITILEKLVDLEFFLQTAYETPSKQWARDMHVSQKRMVLKAWNDIDENPKIKLLDFQQKVLGYLKCVENQLWIWGCYGIEGPLEINLINASHFSFAPNETEESEESQMECYNVIDETTEVFEEEESCGDFQVLVHDPVDVDQHGDNVVVEAVTDHKTGRLREENSQFLKFN